MPPCVTQTKAPEVNLHSTKFLINALMGGYMDIQICEAMEQRGSVDCVMCTYVCIHEILHSNDVNRLNLGYSTNNLKFGNSAESAWE